MRNSEQFLLRAVLPEADNDGPIRLPASLSILGEERTFILAFAHDSEKNCTHSAS
jgi:hypothetical protein